MIGQLSAFLVGGVPFAYVVAKLKAGVDIRRVGSGNVGATNVGRLLGFRWFVVVFLLDFLKGVVPVALALWIRSDAKSTSQAVLMLPEAVGLATILGHVFPVYLNLRGGKGVATTIGVLIVLAPWPLLWGLIAWVMLVLLTRMVSVGSIGFAIVFAMSRLLGSDDLISKENLGLTVFVLAVAALIIGKHASNIGRIIQGTESQVRLPWDAKKSTKTPS
jgi:glycerol-3-phosphate acyltransferase PlsY